MAKTFDVDFYVTCATVIPVLFLAVAVQGSAYASLLRAWQKTQRVSQEGSQAYLKVVQMALKDAQAGEEAQAVEDAQAATQAALDAGQAALDAGQAALDAGQAAQEAQAGIWPILWTLTRGAGAAVVSPFLRALAAVILLAGAGGEGLALYVLYRESEQPGQRLLVLLATLSLVIAVVAGPLLAFLQHYFRQFLHWLKMPFTLLNEVLPSNGTATSRNGRSQDQAEDQQEEEGGTR
jgi:hypothetical protein